MFLQDDVNLIEFFFSQMQIWKQHYVGEYIVSDTQMQKVDG